MSTKKLSAWILCALLAMPALADFSYQETTRITGGSLTRMMKMVPGGGKAMEPQTHHVYLKGNKLANLSQDSINIIDLDAETITDVDLKKQTYAVITFQEMAQALEAAKQKMEAELRKQNKNQQADVNMSFSVKVNETGQRKRISGYDTKEMEMLLEMQMNDQQSAAAGTMQFDVNMWMTPDVDGYDQVRQFYMRMAKKMDWHPRMSSLAGVMNMQPGMGQGMAEMMKEMQKIEGVPVLQVTSMRGGAMGNMPDLSEAMRGAGGDRGQQPDLSDVAAEEARRTATNEAARSASRSTGGRFGRLAGAATSGALGGLGRRKKAEPEPKPEPQPAPQAQASGKPGAFMEMTSESSNFSTAPVDAAKLSVPAGFKQVEHEMKKLLK
jgi:hypothetical protein